MIKCTLFVEFFVKDSVSKAIKTKICNACKDLGGDSRYFFSKGNLIIRFGKDVDWDELNKFNEAVEDAYSGNIEDAYYRVSVFSRSTTKYGTSMLYIGSNQCININSSSNVYAFKSDTLYTKEYFSDWDDKKVLSGSKAVVGINFSTVGKDKCGGNILLKPDGFVSTFDFERREFVISGFSIPNMFLGIDVDNCYMDVENRVSYALGKTFLPGYKYITESLNESFRQTLERFVKTVLDENSSKCELDNEFVLEVVNRKLLTHSNNLFGSCDFTITDLEGLGIIPDAKMTSSQLLVCKNRVCGNSPIYKERILKTPRITKESDCVETNPTHQNIKRPIVVVRKRKVESPKVERNLISANRGTSSYYFDVSKKVLNRQDMLIAGLGYMKETRPNFFNEVIEFWNDIDPDFLFDIETKTVEWEDSQNDIFMETVSGETDIEVRQKIHALTEE